MKVNDLLTEISHMIAAGRITPNSPVQFVCSETDHYGNRREDHVELITEEVDVTKPAHKSWEWDGDTPRELMHEAETRKVRALVVQAVYR